jgi:mono/diheme cytochrome c family protein
LKILIKGLLICVSLALLAASGTYLYFLVILPPDLPIAELKLDRTPERVARGEYLATAVFGCVYCHSERDWELFGGPIKPGGLGKGGERFDESVGFPGLIVSTNITPYHLGDWSDGELYRAIISGLHKDGYAFFPVMPFDVYLYLETEDVYSIMAYLRTLEPIAADHPPRQLSNFMQAIGNSRVKPAEPWVVDQDDPVARGEYLSIIAGCRFCHTPADERRQGIPEMRFGGGLGFPWQDKTVYSANISADPDTGIGNWTVEDFIARFKAYENQRIPVSEVGYNTQMAWTEYAQLTESDLAAIYAYIMSQPAVRNEVTLVR